MQKYHVTIEYTVSKVIEVLGDSPEHAEKIVNEATWKDSQIVDIQESDFNITNTEKV